MVLLSFNNSTLLNRGTSVYAKIFRQMYDGTLATNGPWEALVTFQQMLVLANEDGEVDMTAAAISRVTTIPQQIIERGIGALMAADHESRTPDEEGRRLVLLSVGRSWGWRIVNYGRYRAIKQESDRREYHREYYRKHRSKPVEQVENVETQHVSTNSTASTHTETEAEAEAEAEKNPPTPRKVGNSTVHGFPLGFERWWDAYPKKAAKDAAAKAFARIGPDEVLLGRMLAALAEHCASQQWQKDRGQFVPNPATWLNGRRWEDELPGVPDRAAAMQATIDGVSRRVFGRDPAIENATQVVPERAMLASPAKENP